MRIRTVLSLVCALCLFALPSASPGQVKAPIMPKYGKWAMTQQVPPEQAAAMARMPAQMLKQMGYDYDPAKKTMTTTMCLDAETAKKWGDMDKELRESGQAKCDDPVYSASGDTMTMSLKCTAPQAMSMRNRYTFNAARDGYTYESEMNTTIAGKAETRRTRGSARRVGDC